MEYKLILKMAGLALGTVILEQLLQKSGKQTESTILAFVSIGLMLTFSVGTVLSLGTETTKLFNIGN